MNTFNSLQYAKARLLLAEKENDITEIEKWREHVLYLQRLHDAQKQRLA